MKYLVVGGHARGIGKTALVVDVIRAFPDAAWTAVKISPHGHGAWQEKARVTGREGKASSPKFVLQEERDRTGRTGSSRVLAAGARRAFWLRTAEGSLMEGMRRLGPKLDGSTHVVFESNAVLEDVAPQLCLMVLDPAVEEFKESAKRILDRVDAFVARGPLAGALWQKSPEWPTESKPTFMQRLGEPLPEGLQLLIRNRLFAAAHPPATRRHLPG